MSHSPLRRVREIMLLGSRRGLWTAVAILSLGCTDFDDPEWPDSGRRVTAGMIDLGDLTIASPVSGGRTSIYLRVRNRASEPDTITAIDMYGFGVASVHRTVIEEDVSRMRPEGPVEIPGREIVTFEPGRLHIMVEGLPGGLIVGETVPIAIELSSAGRIDATALVTPYDGVAELFGPGS